MSGCTTSRPARARWSCSCTASRSSGTAGARQIEPLAAAGLRVVAPDLRGYNLSSKPRGVAAYDLDPLACDIRDLIAERGETACVRRRPRLGRRGGVGDRDVPPGGRRAARDPQRAASAAVHRGRAPPAPAGEVLVHGLLPAPGPAGARRPAWFRDHSSRTPVPARSRPPISSASEAWAQPGALTSSLNYYRALSRLTPARGSACRRRRHG